MTPSSVARADITIAVKPDKVWGALTDPAQIKKYLFGTDAESEWKVGSSIVFRGEWQGKKYEDKGRILKIVPNRILAYTYWSSMSGTEDRPENYHTITCELTPVSGGTRLAIAQDNAGDEKSREHSEQNWGTVLKTMKELLEAS